MKTVVPTALNSRKTVLALFAATVIGLTATAQVSGGGNGLSFENYTLQSGTALQVGAKYLFTYVDNSTDAVVTIDSLVNGAKLNKIDDNSNGVGYKAAFQPAVQSGGVVGFSYAVFTVNFYEHGTTNPKALQTVNATAVDIDGSNTLKEFVRLNVGPGGSTSYMNATPDISVTQIALGDYLTQNILGIERSGIDTSALGNMVTATNAGISAFSVKFGTITTVPSNPVRQFSLYMKGFAYPSNTLPVKLASFTATLNNNKADLKWTTASEINVSHFVVERSLDGRTFTDAGMVFAMGNTADAVNYSFADNLSNVTVPVVYYRLRTVDIDARAEYSETRIIRLTKMKENTVSIVTYPNPVSHELRITVPSGWQNKPVIYEVYAINGQVARRIQSASSGQTETLNVSTLAPGLYVVKVTCEGTVAQQKIVKQ